MRHQSILDRSGTALLVVDIQEKISALMTHRQRVVKNTVILIKGLHTLNVPLFITEQYPKGLGPTEKEIAEAYGIGARRRLCVRVVNPRRSWQPC